MLLKLEEAGQTVSIKRMMQSLSNQREVVNGRNNLSELLNFLKLFIYGIDLALVCFVDFSQPLLDVHRL